MSGWADNQVAEFAKRFAKQHAAAWHAYVPAVREAFLDSFVLMIVLGQDRDELQVKDIRSLRVRLCARLTRRHRMLGLDELNGASS